MYTFVFLWTPTLAPRGERVPHGFVLGRERDLSPWVSCVAV